MAWFGALFLVAAFLILFKLFRLVTGTRRAIATAQRAVEILGDPALDELAKEKALQRAALDLFIAFLWITGGAAGALLLPALLMEYAAGFLPTTAEEVYAVTFSAPFLVLSTAVIVAFLYVTRRAPSQRDTNYSASDRLLHNIAFATQPVQVALAGWEDRIAAAKIRDIEIEHPVFVCALPRAGTTILLEILEAQKEFASHTYRDMPFLLVPYLWDRFSRKFQKRADLQERAHRDGMQVGFDSAEAFEEMIWRFFWPAHYEDNRIRPWSEKDNPDFLRFFRNHIRKIMAVRMSDGQERSRYLSKNNGNIARTGTLQAYFPDCTIVIPFRDPVQQAASLLQQHQNFLALHAEDDFARRYMLAIGHYDFGENLKPIDFDGWLSQPSAPDATSLSYWLRYWVQTYRYLLDRNSSHHLWVSYESLCGDPMSELSRIGQRLALNDVATFARHANLFRPPRDHAVDISAIDEALLETAQDLYRQLRALSSA